MPTGRSRLVGSEPHPPYARPPLSKKLWSGGEEEKIWRGTEELGVDLHLGRTVVSVDPDARVATDDQGDDVPVRPDPARHRRAAPPPPRRRGGGRLLPDARRLPAATAARRGGRELRRHRRRLHRLRDRSRAHDAGLRGDDGLPRPGRLRAALPGRSVRVRHRVLPGEGRRGAHRASASRAWRRGAVRHRVREGARRRRDRRRARDRAGHRARRARWASSSTAGSSSTSRAARARRRLGCR